MLSNFKIWFKTAIVLQWMTAAIHSLSFFNDPVAKNETEKTLIDLMRNYRQDLAGSSVSMEELMIALSACFSLLYLFGGLLNWHLLRHATSRAFVTGALWINLLVFGICFAVMAVFTFLPPIVLTGAVFFFLALAQIMAYRGQVG